MLSWQRPARQGKAFRRCSHVHFSPHSLTHCYLGYVISYFGHDVVQMKLLTKVFADHLPPRSVEKLSYEAIVKQSEIVECYVSISSARKGSMLYPESPAFFPPFCVSWSFAGKIKLLFQGDQGWSWKVTKETEFQSHKAMGHITFLIWEN